MSVLSNISSTGSLIAGPYSARIESPVQNKKRNVFVDLVFGSVAGFSGIVFDHPFDTVKVRLQSNPIVLKGGKPVLGGTLTCIRDMVTREGYTSFYRGISAALACSMAETSVLFIAYSFAQTQIRWISSMEASDPLSLTHLSLSGAFSGAVVSFLLTPIELIKCRQQVGSMLSKERLNCKRLDRPGRQDAFRFNSFRFQRIRTESSVSSHPLRGSFPVALHIIRHEGVLGLYRGLLGTLLREVPGGAAWFGVYELTINTFIRYYPELKSKDSLSPLSLAFAGALAGVAYNSALFPADVIKSRQQVNTGGRTGFFDIGHELYKAEGVRGLYRGFGITIFRAAPVSGAIFLTYELLSRNFNFNVGLDT
ncbi:hypothetical protein BASA82_000916 [Batrachochytrium salamandrivorans]|nr:hypothetical protein BASA82_000916 [Batrachochytrium salamandrivorans]